VNHAHDDIKDDADAEKAKDTNDNNNSGRPEALQGMVDGASMTEGVIARALQMLGNLSG
jgi:hypothetical protein